MVSEFCIFTVAIIRVGLRSEHSCNLLTPQKIEFLDGHQCLENMNVLRDIFWNVRLEQCTIPSNTNIDD